MPSWHDLDDHERRLPLFDARSSNPLEASIARLRAEAVQRRDDEARVLSGEVHEQRDLAEERAQAAAQHEEQEAELAAETPRQCPSCQVYFFGATHTCVEYDAGNPCSTPGCGAPTVWVTIAAPGTGSGRQCSAGHYHGTCRELTPEEVR